MIVGFDAKRAFHNFSGLGNFSRWYIENYVNIFNKDKVILYGQSKKSSFYNKMLNKKCSFYEEQGVFSYKPFKYLWRAFLPFFLKQNYKPNIFHGLSNELPIIKDKNTKYILTIHDVIFISNPELYKKHDVFIYKKKLSKSIKNADIIHCISEKTKNELTKYFYKETINKKIRVIYQSCDNIFFNKHSKVEIKNFKIKYGLPKEFILNVSTIEKRKNQLLLIKSLEEKSIELPLVIVGKKTSYFNYLQEYIIKKKLSNKVFFFDNIPFIEFPKLYQGASLLVYPSIIEGFGIPVLEAMFSNLPVAVTKGTSMEEAACGHALTFDNNIDQIRETIKLALASKIKYPTEITEKYKVKNLMVQYNNMYKEVLNI